MANTNDGGAEENFGWVPMHQDLRRGIQREFNEILPLQARILLSLSHRNNIVVQAHSGTGKTTAIAMSVLQQVHDNDHNHPFQALVLLPCRELAEQLHSIVAKMGKHIVNIKELVHLAIGGSQLRGDYDKLITSTQVAITTPGRLSPLVKCGMLNMQNLHAIFVDDADQLLSQGFFDELQVLHYVFQQRADDALVALFCTNMSEDLAALARRLVPHADHIAVRDNSHRLSGTKHLYCNAGEQDLRGRLQALSELCKIYSESQIFVFTESHRAVEAIAVELAACDPTVMRLSPESPFKVREETLSRFCTGACRVLVSTDRVAQAVIAGNHNAKIIINFDVPRHEDEYLRRARHAAPAGAVVSLVSSRDVNALRKIEECYRINIEHLPLNIAEHTIHYYC
ncbi:eukaryotic initiation factor 4a, putative [Bodo saltans]|uniref:Eukaryotic initiation factor 4a, putative n=1 Tax=Bodo saltans TaxID=75058 RepID=A0A0S4KPB7_BODSA|nr:eukaryotic initiation factor 4a, putative [Bodo saltans]|eukprot:CUI15402.1 eukaryotic initiation factor 4a, putative [Bodo saltans]